MSFPETQQGMISALLVFLLDIFFSSKNSHQGSSKMIQVLKHFPKNDCVPSTESHFGVQPAESSESYYCEDRQQASTSEKEDRNTAQIVMTFAGKLQEGSLVLGGPRAHSVLRVKAPMERNCKDETLQRDWLSFSHLHCMRRLNTLLKFTIRLTLRTVCVPFGNDFNFIFN